MWPDGTHPCYSLSQVVSACLFFLNIERVWPYRYAYNVPMVTVILYMCVCVGLCV